MAIAAGAAVGKSNKSRRTVRKSETNAIGQNKAGRIFSNFVNDALKANKDEESKYVGYEELILKGTQDSYFNQR